MDHRGLHGSRFSDLSEPDRDPDTPRVPAINPPRK